MVRKGQKKDNKNAKDKKKGNVKSAKKDKKTAQDSTKQTSPPKFRFVCQLCGLCCENSKISITITDIERWVSDNTIYRVMHLLQLIEADGEFTIYLKNDEDGCCNLYHRDDKKCTIYDNRPLFCRSYPLSYDGEKYSLKSKECKGLNQSDMTKAQLKEIRDNAFEEYVALRQSRGMLPILYGIIFNKLIADSQQFMQQYSDEVGMNVEDLGELAKKLKNNNDDD